PSWQTTDCEQYGEEVSWEAHCAVDQAGVEVYVRVELAGDEVIISQCNFFQLDCQIRKIVATEMLEDLVCGLLDDCCTWIVVLVNAVYEADEVDAVFLVLDFVHELGCVATVVALDVYEHLQNSLVCATVQWAGQSVDATSDGDKHVGLCGTQHTNGGG